ncbi:MAG: fibrobacter succinogenes major paralogous domain-containing protein [Candidatus Marinimicrobia bacterium]|nr:fibrobacter succinogenes major paralogous domain-containing protein [Candidatus Neomarinimicrobiota bacterium]
MKKFLLMSVLFVTPILAQCDWDNDGQLNVIDVVNMVDCILNNCWTGDILGCTDPAASNYDPNATIDDCSCESADTVTDIDGNVYTSVNICDQEWMVENLATSHYNNGDPIPNITDYTWVNLTTGAYGDYNNDPANSSTYGRLYNWFTLNDSRGIAPAGWHVPSDTEWQELVDCYGGSISAGGPLKDTGTVEGGDGYWYAPNGGATNLSGFTGLPGGKRLNYNGLDYDLGNLGYFWTSTLNASTTAWHRELYYYHTEVYHYGNTPLQTGLSIRCIKDN